MYPFNMVSCLQEVGAIDQLVEQWSCNLVTRVRKQVNALVPFDKCINSDYQVPRRRVKAVGHLVAYTSMHAFLDTC